MIYAYIRASGWTQTLSIETQTELIKNYAKLIGEELLDENIYSDPATSSKYPLDRRKAGSVLCQKLQPGDSLIALRMDRLFRKTSEFEHYLKKWVLNPAGEIILHFVEQGGQAINGKTASGRLMLRIFAAFAEFERDLIRDRTRETHAVQKQKRRRITRDPGPGFMWFPVGYKDDGSRLYTHVINNDEMKIIEKFLEWFEKGMTLDQISAHCKSVGLVRKFLRTKKKRDEYGNYVNKMNGKRTEEEWVELPWNRDSIHRGIKTLKAMNKQQEEAGPDE